MSKKLSLGVFAFVSLSLLGCSTGQKARVISSPSPSSPPLEASIVMESPSADPLTDVFEAGLEKASKASFSARNATSKEDWDLTASRWQKAIDLMKSLPVNDPNYAQALKNISQYQKNLDLAKKKAKTMDIDTNSIAIATLSTQPESNEISIEDFFASYMDATVNRGRSGSEYWCSQSKQFESSFFAPRSYRVLDVHLAPSNKGGSITFQLDSSNRGGSQITANWVIVIAKEKNKKVAKQTLGGWCISMLWDKS